MKKHGSTRWRPGQRPRRRTRWARKGDIGTWCLPPLRRTSPGWRGSLASAAAAHSVRIMGTWLPSRSPKYWMVSHTGRLLRGRGAAGWSAGLVRARLGALRSPRGCDPVRYRSVRSRRPPGRRPRRLPQRELIPGTGSSRRGRFDGGDHGQLVQNTPAGIASRTARWILGSLSKFFLSLTDRRPTMSRT